MHSERDLWPKKDLKTLISRKTNSLLHVCRKPLGFRGNICVWFHKAEGSNWVEGDTGQWVGSSLVVQQCTGLSYKVCYRLVYLSRPSLGDAVKSLDWRGHWVRGPLRSRCSLILWLRTFKGAGQATWRKSEENKVYRASETNVRIPRKAWLFLNQQRCWNS